MKPMNDAIVNWQKPEDAFCVPSTEYGCVDGMIVRLDTSFPYHDGGPEFRQARFDLAVGGFICSATGCNLRNVTGWVLGR